MTDLILHHYDSSPFSEKVRLVMGLKSLAWRSVTVPIMLPKPDVVALTGGYRRTPFLQVGADIYCDSALVCRVLEQRAPEPPLYPAAAGGLQHIVAHWADSTLFWAAIPLALQTGGLALPGASPEMLKAFGADRAAMTAGRVRVGPLDNTVHLHQQLAWLESLLADGRPFLLGGVPCIADVSAAQSVWHLRRAPLLASLFQAYPKVAAWYDRVAAFGHGTASPLDSGEAIDIARRTAAHAPVAVAPGLGLDAGTPVAVSATDYGTEPNEGTLVGLTADEVVIERTDERAGRLHVHFPRLGYQVKPVRS